MWFRCWLVCLGVILAAQTGMARETTGLCAAAQQGNEATVKSMIAVGVDVNSPCGEYQRTPLMYAVMSDSVKTVEAIVNAGASLNAQDEYGYT